LVDLGFDPNLASVAFHDSKANRQTDARSGDASPMQPLEDAKNLLVILGRNSNAVIGHAKLPQTTLTHGRHMDLQRTLTSVLKGVADQILEELNELWLVAVDCRQRIARDAPSGFLDRGLTVLDSRLEDVIKIDLLKSLTITR
jgi:hypothetical protein